MSEKKEQPAAATAEQKVFTLGQLEEDDEFEEFPVEEWAKEDMEDQHQWEDNWDDDDISDDFSKQLRQELEKQQQQKKMQH